MTTVATKMLDTAMGVHRVRLAGGGPPLFVIPGGPGFGATYLVESITSLLGDSHRLVFIDQRGAGGSPVGHSPLSIEAYVQDTAAVADALGIDRFDIMGHSFGGLQTMLVAVAFPDRVQRIVLVDGEAPTKSLFDSAQAPGTPIYQRTRSEDVAEKAAISASPDWMFDQGKLDRWLILQFRPFYTDPSMSARIPHDFDGRRYIQWRATSSTVRGSLGDWDVTALLPSISAPVLLVCCRESILGRDTPDTYERLLPDVSLVWVDGGHTPPSEDPVAFASAVHTFFNTTKNRK